MKQIKYVYRQLRPLVVADEGVLVNSLLLRLVHATPMRLILARKPISFTRSSLLLWVAITLLFLYERMYLIQKAGLPHFVECVVVRVSLLLLLCYIHSEVLVARLLSRRNYGWYGLMTAAAVGVYLLIQGLYDRYLFGFVIGDQQRAGLWLNLPYNLLVTGWYLLLTYLIHRTLHPNSQSSELLEPPLSITDDRLVIKTGTQWIQLSVAQIRYAQGLKDYTILYTQHEKYIVKGSVGKVATWLPEGQFMRVHKSYLVAKQHIMSTSTTEITLDGQVIPVGRTYATAVIRQFKTIETTKNPPGT